MTRRVLVSLAYGFVIGLAVGITLESSGALVWLDRRIAELVRRGPRPEVVRLEQADETAG